MKQTKHEYAIDKIQELTEKYNLPKLCCLFCVYAKFKQVGRLDYKMLDSFLAGGIINQ